MAGKPFKGKESKKEEKGEMKMAGGSKARYARMEKMMEGEGKKKKAPIKRKR